MTTPFRYFGKINFAPYTKVEKFADYLKNGKLMGTKCKHCGKINFPPRADCNSCMNSDFEWIESNGIGELESFTKIHAAPTGFDDIAPYIIGVLKLDQGGKLLGWIEGLKEDDLTIGMKLRAVPKIFEEIPEIKLYYVIKR